MPCRVPLILKIFLVYLFIGSFSDAFPGVKNSLVEYDVIEGCPDKAAFVKGLHDKWGVVLTRKTQIKIESHGQDLRLELKVDEKIKTVIGTCLLYTSPSPRDATLSRMPSSA